MTDRIFDAFLTSQHADALALNADSDLIALSFPEVASGPHRQYIAEFSCGGLVHSHSRGVEEARRFTVGLTFPSDYLRRVEPSEVLTWLGPFEIWHPNIRPPFICVGRLSPGTPLTDLLYQCFEIISYQKVTMREDDALNIDACSWARQHQSRFPVDPRPLKRRSAEARIEAVGRP